MAHIVAFSELLSDVFYQVFKNFIVFDVPFLYFVADVNCFFYVLVCVFGERDDCSIACGRATAFWLIERLFKCFEIGLFLFRVEYGSGSEKV